MRYFDLHCDTIARCVLENEPLKANRLHISLDAAQPFKPWFQVFAVWIPDGIRGEEALSRFDLLTETFRREIKKNESCIQFCRSADDLKDALNKDKNAALLSVEGGAALGGRMERLFAAYDKGVRMMTLTWNGACELGDGCREPDAKGLTGFGREAVKEMERLGMVIDVSHLSQKGFDDVAALTKAPFVASHSNSAALCPHPRNLTDGQIREIIRRGGLIGLNLFPPFVREDEKTAPADILPHADRILSLGGERVLSVGADFDGVSSLPDGVTGIGSMTGLYNLLEGRYGKPTADRIFFQNAFDFFAAALTPAQR